MADKPEAIEFLATVSQVRTLADFGLRVVLDLDENKIVEAAWLMAQRAKQGVVRVRIEATDGKS